MNKLIRGAAIRGGIDCLGPIEINWRVSESYVFVFIEEYTGKWWYRVFISTGVFHYDRDRILYPKDGGEDLLCIYDCYENIAGSEQEIQMLQEGDWMQQITAAVEEEMRE